MIYYKIKPKVQYKGNDLDWNKKTSRSTIECKNRNSRPELADKNANISKYNTILVGLPVVSCSKYYFNIS